MFARFVCSFPFFVAFWMLSQVFVFCELPLLLLSFLLSTNRIFSSASPSKPLRHWESRHSSILPFPAWYQRTFVVVYCLLFSSFNKWRLFSSQHYFIVFYKTLYHLCCIKVNVLRTTFPLYCVSSIICSFCVCRFIG